MNTPHQILSAYSQGRISAIQAMSALHMDGRLELLIAMADAGNPLPRPAADEVERQVKAAVPLLRAALIGQTDGKHA